MKTISLLTFVVIVTDRKSEYYITRFPTDDIKRLTLLGDDARSGTELGLGRPRWWLPLWPAIGWATSGTPGDLSPQEAPAKATCLPRASLSGLRKRGGDGSCRCPDHLPCQPPPAASHLQSPGNRGGQLVLWAHAGSDRGTQAYSLGSAMKCGLLGWRKSCVK